MNNVLQRITVIASLVSLSIALEVIFDAIPFFNMWAQGGGISLAMLPLIILAFISGPIYGTIGGVIFGLVNLLLAGRLYHPASLFLDYILPFGLIGMCGFFNNALKGNFYMFSLAFVFVAFERIAFHTISGIVAFEATLWFSLAYNAPYILISTAFCFIVGLLIYRQLETIFEKQLQNPEQ